MIEVPLLADVIKVLFILVLCTAALILTQRTLTSLFTIYAIQSVLVALMALVLYAESGSLVLLLLALLTIISKAIAIPYVLRRIQSSIEIKRDLQFRYLTPIGSLLASTVLIFLVYQAAARFLPSLSQDNLLFLGAVIGVSLMLMGMLVIFSRRKIITKIVGYLTMENGVLLFSLFVSELPFIIEVLIILDLIMLIVLATILAFGIDSSVDEFHEKLNSFASIWFKK